VVMPWGRWVFYDLERRLDALSAKGDPLESLKGIVPWEVFQAPIERATRLKPKDGKSNAGRKPFDAVLMFKILVLQSLYNLPNEQTEFPIQNRFSFMRLRA
jgi:IS5 family transposase